MRINDKFKIKIYRQTLERVRFRIIEQPRSWRNEQEGEKIFIFKSFNGNSEYCNIASCNCPQIIEDSNIFYIQGLWRHYDNEEVSCSRKFFRKVNNTLEKAMKIDPNIKNDLIY